LIFYADATHAPLMHPSLLILFCSREQQIELDR